MERDEKPSGAPKVRRTGQIVPRGERKWMVRVCLGRDPQTGKRIELNHTVHGSKRDAQVYLNAKLRERDLGMCTGVQHTPVSALFDDLLRDYRINGKSIDWAEIVVGVHLRPFFGAMKAANVGTDAIRRYIEHRQKPDKRQYQDAKGNKRERAYPPASNGTINRELALLRRSYNLGKRATPPKVGAVPYIPMLAENPPRKGFFEHDAFLAVRRALDEEIKPVITFAYYTGCRRGEILALVWPQVDFAERVVRLEPGETKNDEARTIPLVPELYEMLLMLKETRDRYFPASSWVFSRVGEQIKDFRGAWDSACKKAGLVDANGDAQKLFHDLRRTGVRNLIRAGVPERVAMTISGHKTRAVFDRYNIVSESDLKDAARKLGDYMATKTAPEVAAETDWRTTGAQPPSPQVN